MDTLDFNKHNINIFINETWQKYAGDYSKLQDVFFARIDDYFFRAICHLKLFEFFFIISLWHAYDPHQLNTGNIYLIT
jgi:hypothetical protein